MRILAGLGAFWLGMTLSLTHPQAAVAVEGDQNWQSCIGATAKPDDRVSACTVVIAAQAETGANWPRPIATAAKASPKNVNSISRCPISTKRSGSIRLILAPMAIAVISITASATPRMR